MKQERLMKVLAGPVISEKSTMVAEKHRQYTFRVVADATKPEVKAAVKGLPVCRPGVTTFTMWRRPADVGFVLTRAIYFTSCAKLIS